MLNSLLTDSFFLDFELFFWKCYLKTNTGGARFLVLEKYSGAIWVKPEINTLVLKLGIKNISPNGIELKSISILLKRKKAALV